MSTNALIVRPPPDDYFERFQSGYDGHERSEGVGEIQRAADVGLETFDGRLKKLTYNVGFDMSNSRHGDGHLETVVDEADWRDLFCLNAHCEPDLENIDLSRVALNKVEIVGSTLPEKAKYALQIYDRNLKPLFKQHAFKNNQSASWEKYGWPLYAKDNVILKTPNHLSREHRLYGKIKGSDFENGVILIDYPATENAPERSLVLVERNSRACALLCWLLEDCNGACQNIRSSPQYSDANHPNYLQVNRTLWDDVVQAYSRKLEEVQFNDLSQITVRMVPTGDDDFELLAASRRERDDDSARNTTEHIQLEFSGYFDEMS